LSTVVAGLRDVDVVLLAVYALAAGMLVASVLPASQPSSRLRAVTAGLGGLTVVASAVVATSDSRRMAGQVLRHPRAFAGGVIAFVLALGLVELALARLGRRAGIAVLAVIVAASLVLTSRLVASNEDFGAGLALPERGRVVAELTVPGSPLAGALDGANRGFLGLAEGRILRFGLRGSALTTTQVASGLGQVRGIAVSGRSLYASEIVSWPCEDPPTKPGLAVCTRDFGATKDEGELAIIRESQARISRFAIASDGSLGERETVVDRLPVVSGEHAPNGLATGPDGRVYASVGNVDGLWRAPEKLRALDRPHLDLLGTIVRLDGTKPTVFARGLRNVYGIAFGSDGRLYGTDNDGPTQVGFRGEEVDHIAQGDDFGYPKEGSSGPFTVRTRTPLWILDDVASAGIAWVDRDFPGPGLAIGSLNGLWYVPLNVEGASPRVVGKPEPIERSTGFRAVVLSLPDGRLVAGGPGPLRLIDAG
jgi:hypothetical protein